MYWRTAEYTPSGMAIAHRSTIDTTTRIIEFWMGRVITLDTGWLLENDNPRSPWTMLAIQRTYWT